MKKFCGTADNDVKIKVDEKEYTIERSELQRATNIAIKTLVEEYLVARKIQDAVDEQVRAARLGMFGKAAGSSNSDDVSQATTYTHESPTSYTN